MPKTMTAAEFKDQCLKVMDRVKKTRREIVVTKRGKPVVRILPAADEEPELELEGLILHQDRDLTSTGEGWEADS